MTAIKAPATSLAQHHAALLVDIVRSRNSDRNQSHRTLIAAAEHTNALHQAIDPIRPTVGDEAQAVYATLGSALAAAYTLRLHCASAQHPVDLRIGIGTGEVRTVDADRHIQDGSAWWAAREAIDFITATAQQAHFAHLRMHVIDSRPEANSLTNPTLQLLDAQLSRMRPQPLGTLRHLLEGLSNQDAAAQLGISASANSQRVRQHHMHTMAEAITALATLP